MAHIACLNSVKTTFYRLSSYLLVLATASCTVSTPYEPPHVAVPEEWKGNSPATHSNHAPASLSNWWQLFDDPDLNILVEKALAANPQLSTARARVEESWQIARQTRSALYPYVTLAPSTTHIGTRVANGALAALPGGNPTLNTPPVVNPASLAASVLTPCQSTTTAAIPAAALANAALNATPERFHVRFYQMPLTLSYNCDLWGQYYSLWQAQMLLATAEEAQLHLTQLTITAQVATAYYQLRSLDRQCQLLEAHVDTLKQALQINQKRYQSGLVTYLDVARAAEQVSEAAANMAFTCGQRTITEDLIAALIGVPAPSFEHSFLPLTDQPPAPPLVFPCQLLRQRPDIQAVEYQLQAAHAQINAAYADFFPDLQINGTIGFASSHLAQLFDWRSRLWQYTIQLVQTLFDASRRDAILAQNKALYIQHVGTFEAQVLQAFREVEDALADIQASQEQYKHLEHAVLAAQQTLQLSQQRYLKGLVTYLDVASAQVTLINVELSAAAALQQHYLAVVNLCKALGGSW
jgi:multidrug efflux system outer membrane protein